MYAPLNRPPRDVKLAVFCDGCLELRPYGGDCSYCVRCQQELADGWPEDDEDLGAVDFPDPA